MKTTPFLIIMFVILFTACGPSSTTKQSAWTACTRFVEEMVPDASLKAQDYNPNDVEDIGDDRYRVAVDAIYDGRDQTYWCELVKQPDGNWDLEVLEASWLP